MPDQRIDAITKDLQVVKDASTRLLQRLGPEKVTYEMVRGDVSAQLQKLENVKKAVEQELNRLDIVKNEAVEIIQKAKEEAQKKIDSAEKVILRALSIHNETQKFATEVDKKRWRDHAKELNQAKEEIANEHPSTDKRPDKDTDKRDKR